ncbi:MULTISPECIES: hypothetical protein [unclassified Neisseria]|uniref:hypothetical protein n=1 Tax=unclassified Neisseria TaxID=2623750 RepID=UPI002666DA9C|nr:MULTISPECIES: hypothetical protein [unclassified Neisseria]MDO1509205.1 hypothetical protein [Neisseria sp. MVDL19-042950]MDO1515516.1 hypothetical protein [Neisseria sp. MVDL18-041461]MDO1562875.1 hypothetical protein [Neisseria sp. MVDL20-010259]
MKYYFFGGVLLLCSAVTLSAPVFSENTNKHKQDGYFPGMLIVKNEYVRLQDCTRRSEYILLPSGKYGYEAMAELISVRKNTPIDVPVSVGLKGEVEYTPENEPTENFLITDIAFIKQGESCYIEMKPQQSELSKSSDSRDGLHVSESGQQKSGFTTPKTDSSDTEEKAGIGIEEKNKAVSSSATQLKEESLPKFEEQEPKAQKNQSISSSQNLHSEAIKESASFAPTPEATAAAEKTVESSTESTTLKNDDIPTKNRNVITEKEKRKPISLSIPQKRSSLTANTLIENPSAPTQNVAAISNQNDVEKVTEQKAAE